MKKAGSILLILSLSLAKAQTHRFFYEVKYKEDSTQANYQKAFTVLDINPDETKYYDNSFLEKDSVNNINKSQNTNWTAQIPVTRKKNSSKNINFAFAGDQLYSYSTEDPVEWKLSEETKKTADFNLQKATTNFGGRKWTAWFTKEIPFSEGPYKFKGLPGLIISLEDSQKQFSFSLIKSKKLDQTYDTKNILEVRYGDKPLNVSEKIFIKKSLEYYEDPYQEDRINLKKGNTIIEIDGKKYTNASDLIPLIKSEQEYIRKQNNPIELNKAIRYPMK
ncbi:GLPGLI family protein [Chryseobacterium luquanense]|uniref:GLPGLI family protein n=1 Tax=Chryseobacterium luquanense TaxID=2983766 RepID=A0ABT3Y4V0_9FLAO|nr:GLPGLI family protein [Chryseobacterium luquanense]MCX8533168.1 GLPGLI family protein [Chryseobacterium luquanense]